MLFKCSFSFWGGADNFGLPGSGPDQDFLTGSGFADSIESGSEALVETLVVGSTRLQFLFVIIKRNRLDARYT
jgi:hypothetical protein